MRPLKTCHMFHVMQWYTAAAVTDSKMCQPPVKLLHGTKSAIWPHLGRVLVPYIHWPAAEVTQWLGQISNVDDASFAAATSSATRSKGLRQAGDTSKSLQQARATPHGQGWDCGGGSSGTFCRECAVQEQLADSGVGTGALRGKTPAQP